MFDITKYSSTLDVILEKRDGKILITYSRFNPISGQKTTIQESLDKNQVIILKDRLKTKLDNINAFMDDVNALETGV